MEARPGFSLQFLLQFWRLHLIFYSSHLSLLVFFLFIGASCLYTFLGYRVGLISGELHQFGCVSSCAHPGNFYKVLVDRDHDQFVWECLTSTGLVVAISVIKYGTTKDMCCWNEKILKVWKELSSTTPDGPMATILDIPHAKALYSWSQLLQGRGGRP